MSECIVVFIPKNDGTRAEVMLTQYLPGVPVQTGKKKRLG